MSGDLSVSGGKLKTPVGDAPVLPLLIIGTGAYLAWFGIHYWRSDTRWPTDPVKSFLQGKGLTPATPVEPVQATLTAVESQTAAGGSSGGLGVSGATGSVISDDALKYEGAGYVFGGRADKPGDWDCSSFVSYVLGHDLGIKLPGGSWGDPGFPPHSHGPTTTAYKLYGQRISRDEVRAGDLVVWNTHMGIAISNERMISAQDPKDGTGKSGIDGAIPGETAHFRRVTAGGSGQFGGGNL
jgi:cell wall-associated NlpC family hydrolase